MLLQCIGSTWGIYGNGRENVNYNLPQKMVWVLGLGCKASGFGNRKNTRDPKLTKRTEKAPVLVLGKSSKPLAAKRRKDWVAVKELKLSYNDMELQ